MTIRLNKVTRDFNVGIQRVVAFLHEKGFAVEANPNARITDEQFELCKKKFKADKVLKGQSTQIGQERQRTEQQRNKDSVTIKDYDPSTKRKTEETKATTDTKQTNRVQDHTDQSSPRHIAIEPAEKAPAESPETDDKPATMSPAATPAAVAETEPVALAEPIVPVVESPSTSSPAAAQPDSDLSQAETKMDEEAKSDGEAQPAEASPSEGNAQAETQAEAQPTSPKDGEDLTDSVAPEGEAQASGSQEGPVVQTANNESQSDETKDQQDVLVESSPGVYTVAHTGPKVGVNVVGQIDLNAINQSTRPKKKSKEELKKERKEKEQQRINQRNQFKESLMKEIRHGGNPAGVNTVSSRSADSATSGSAVADVDGGGREKRRRIRTGKVDITNPQNFPTSERTPSDTDHGKRNGRKSSGSDTRRGDAAKDGHTTRDHSVTSGRRGQPAKQDVSEEDVAKQVKETLDRLTAKNKNKGAKYRKEKRDTATRRQHIRESQEEAESRTLKLTEFVTANELANMMDVPVTSVISTCMSVGIMVSINQRLDADTINLVADEFGFRTEYVSAEVAQAIIEEEDAEEDLQPRAPIVTVMGHVDHGKTSLLDYIRKSNVIAGEAGGITQHIGAYNVTLEDGRKITFLDTPGHEAFNAMRARGAKVTDIAIIIVAADDSVMPQTKEAINHAMAAGVPIVFAINKIDKPGANPEKIKEELANMNFLVEEWGGKYQSQDISAKKGIGVNDLMEKVLLEAEMLELRANPNRRATGSVIESSLDKGRGYVATVLVSNGTLRVGDILLAGTNYGRVKAMFNERNQRMKEAGPAEPALVLGLNGAPAAGDTFHIIETEQEAREIASKREQLQREQGLRTQKMLTLDEVGRRLALGDFHELNIIVKGDVDGSVEALSDSLIKLTTEQIQVNVIHKGVGQISESDVSLAAASDAIIVGFQVRPSGGAAKLAEQEGVDIRKYSVIYDAIEEVKAAMIGMLAPTVKEQITATIEVREVFNISKVGMVAGAMVKTGKVKRSDKARLIRDGIVIFTGNINALKRFKDDVKEVSINFECGISLVGCNDLKPGDIIESFEEVEVKQTL